MVSVMLYPCMFCVALSMDLFVLPCQWICLCCPVNGSVCCVFDGVCELFGETIRNMFGCVCYFVAEGD